MAYRPIEEFEDILRETPPAARYLDLHWSLASNFTEWREIRSRMSGAFHAVQFIDHAAASDYALLRDIAAMRADDCSRAMPFFCVHAA